MLSSLDRRYGDVEGNRPLVLATVLHPWFKDKFFSGKTNAKELLDEKVAEITGTDEPRIPSPKRPKTDLLRCFADILEEAGVDVNTHNTIVDKYLPDLWYPSIEGIRSAGGQKQDPFSTSFQVGSKIFVHSNLCPLREALFWCWWNLRSKEEPSCPWESWNAIIHQKQSDSCRW